MYRMIVTAGIIGLVVGCGEESPSTSSPSGGSSTPVSQPLVADSGHEEAVQNAVDDAASDADSGAGVPSEGDDGSGDVIAGEVGDVVERYVAQVLEASQILERIDSQMSAVTNAPAVQSAMSLLGELVTQLEAQSPETMALVRDRFGEEIGNAQSLLQAQAERILGDSELSGAVGEWIQSIPSIDM
ncbi:MAG: hypothetical protein ACYTF7_05735 [Planctomycetota bacterium]|jgi:hypothetical protein